MKTTELYYVRVPWGKDGDLHIATEAFEVKPKTYVRVPNADGHREYPARLLISEVEHGAAFTRRFDINPPYGRTREEAIERFIAKVAGHNVALGVRIDQCREAIEKNEARIAQAKALREA